MQGEGRSRGWCCEGQNSVWGSVGIGAWQEHCCCYCGLVTRMLVLLLSNAWLLLVLSVAAAARRRSVPIVHSLLLCALLGPLGIVSHLVTKVGDCLSD